MRLGISACWLAVHFSTCKPVQVPRVLLDCVGAALSQSCCSLSRGTSGGINPPAEESTRQLASWACMRAGVQGGQVLQARLPSGAQRYQAMAGTPLSSSCPVVVQGICGRGPQDSRPALQCLGS